MLWPSGAEALWSCLGSWSAACAWAGAIIVVEQQSAQNAALWRVTYAGALWTARSRLMLAVHPNLGSQSPDLLYQGWAHCPTVVLMVTGA